MSEAKTVCIDCSVAILQTTADRNKGRCAPCQNKFAATPPKDFEIPSDLAKRIISREEIPSDYLKMAWRDGAGFVHSYLDRVEKGEELYATWAPKLREYEQECRRSNPSPLWESLTKKERAKLVIYRSKIEAAEPFPDRKKHRRMVLICSLPVIAIPIAQELWPGQDERAVFLTPEELSKWGKIYQHPEDSFWWFMRYWWDIEDPPRKNSIWSEDKALAVPNGLTPWIVISGLIWGATAGGETAEFWAWNGEAAVFVDQVGVLDF